METLLEKFLMPRINAKFTSKAAFAKEVIAHKNTNTSGVHLAMILAGKRPAPVDALESWIRALELDPSATEEFSFLAGLSHLPPKLHPLFLRLFNESRASRGLSSLPATSGISPKKTEIKVKKKRAARTKKP